MTRDTLSSQNTLDELPPSVCAEAAAWVARLHGSDRSPTLEAGFRRWLDASPEHRRAFELATDAWEIGGSIAGAALPRMAQPSSTTRDRRNGVLRPLPTAIALGVVVLGAVWYLRPWEPAVSTRIGEQRTLTLEDSSRITLNTDTRIVVRYDEQHRRVHLEEGEALFDVAHNPARPFIVTAGDREITALGTSFVVRRDDQAIAVTLVEGKVTVAPLTHSSESAEPPAIEVVTLTPGQRLTIANDASPKLDEPSVEAVTAWRRGEVVLDNTRLEDAIEEMNRYSVVKLAIEHPQTADIRISGIFRAGDSARFALAVAETCHLQVTHQPRRIVLNGARGSYLPSTEIETGEMEVQ